MERAVAKGCGVEEREGELAVVRGSDFRSNFGQFPIPSPLLPPPSFPIDPSFPFSKLSPARK